jgi:hypothetical protein
MSRAAHVSNSLTHTESDALKMARYAGVSHIGPKDLVSVCVNWRRKRDSSALSQRAIIWCLVFWSAASIATSIMEQLGFSFVVAAAVIG